MHGNYSACLHHHPPAPRLPCRGLSAPQLGEGSLPLRLSTYLPRWKASWGTSVPFNSFFEGSPGHVAGFQLTSRHLGDSPSTVSFFGFHRCMLRTTALASAPREHVNCSSGPWGLRLRPRGGGGLGSRLRGTPPTRPRPVTGTR